MRDAFSVSLPSQPNSTPPNNNDNTVILMDDNFHLRGMRKQIHRLLLLKYESIRFGILYMQTPIEICLERNRNRPGRRRVPDDIIMKMHAVLEPPRAAWEVDSTKMIVNCTFSNISSKDDRLDGTPTPTPTTFDEIVDFIEKCPIIVELPPEADAIADLEQQAADRTKTLESQIHNMDKLCRSYVGRVAKFDKTYAKAANAARKKLMQEFKAGRFEFEMEVDKNDKFSERILVDAFLDLVVPVDTTSNTEAADSDPNYTLRSQLRDAFKCLSTT